VRTGKKARYVSCGEHDALVKLKPQFPAVDEFILMNGMHQTF
jgi:hypothetical protein